MEAIEKRSITCCFSGHRELPEEKVQQLGAKIEKAVRKLITKHGVCYFGVGVRLVLILWWQKSCSE